MKKEIISRVVLAAIFLLIVAGINYFLRITINLRYPSFWFFTLFIIGLYEFIYQLYKQELVTPFLKRGGSQQMVFDPIAKKYYRVVGNQKVPMSLTSKSLKICGGILGATILLPILFMIISSPLFFSSSYQGLIGEVVEKDYATDFTFNEINQLPVVDHELAVQLGDKKLGEVRGLGSEFHVGEFSDILLMEDGNAVPYAVAPLEYNGFFKWSNNKSGTPGYIKVNKITEEVELVQEVDGKSLNLKYLNSAYFGSNLDRHTYFSGHMTNSLYGYYFELDDNGNPYFVIPKTNRNIGISGGKDVYEVVVVNPQSGEVKSYTPSNAPEWVDNIYPKSLVINQLDDWGAYVNGFMNTLFGQKDMVVTSQGSRRAYNNGQMSHYTGLTSISSDESTTGFVFVTTKEKKVTFYPVAGATENAAMQSAEGKVQNLGYTATFPVPINISGQATFYITLKDNKGLVKLHSFVNVEDYQVVATGETISEAKANYLIAISNKGTAGQGQTETISGDVERIGWYMQQGIKYNTIKLVGRDEIFVVSTMLSTEVPITNIGDTITIDVIETQVVEFKNNTLNP